MATTNSQVAHAWAHGLDKAHYGSSFGHHTDGTLMSYSTCIGERIEIGDKIVFVLDNASYSSSTNKHQCEASRAVPTGDPNVEVFYTPGHAHWDRSYIIGRFGDTDENRMEFGLQYLVDELEHCVALKTCNSIEHGFSYNGYDEMLRWFEVTGCASLKKLMKMNSETLARHMRRVMQANSELKWKFSDRKCKQFLKMMSERKPIEEIADAINGKGCWEAYQNRIAGSMLAKRTRRLKAKMLFCTTSSARCTASYYGVGFRPIESDIKVTGATIDKHRKAGDLAKWMAGVRKHNGERNLLMVERKAMHDRMEDAKKRLEYHLGLTCFEKRQYLNHGKRCYWQEMPMHESYNYNGNVITFRDYHGLHEKPLSTEEYQEFRQLTGDAKAEWMRAKKDWMYNQLCDDIRRWQEWEAGRDERQRQFELEMQELKAREEANREYIERLKAQGAAGISQLWHEGYRVNVYSLSPEAFDGGNVWLRYDEKKNLVISSKNISIPVDECKRLWAFVNRWHNTGETYMKPSVDAHATDHTYAIHSYKDDILTAGCHQIAYTEMQSIAQKLQII